MAVSRTHVRPEFERIDGQREVKLTRPFTTPNGARIRALMPSRRSALLTEIGDVIGDLTVVVCWPPDEEPDDDDIVYFLGELWDKVKGAAGAVVDAVIGVLVEGGGGSGGGGDCQPATNVNVNVSGGSVRDVSVTVNCS